MHFGRSLRELARSDQTRAVGSPRLPGGVLGALSVFVVMVIVMSAPLGCKPAEESTAKGAHATPERLDSDAMGLAVGEMLRMSDTLDRNRRLVGLMDALTQENLPGAIAAFEKDLTRLDPHESRLFANAWARIDPKGALDRMLEAWVYPRIAFQSVEEVVYVWARSDDAASARAYVDPAIEEGSLPGRSPTNYTILAVLKALAVAEEYGELTTLFESLAEDPKRDHFLTEVMIEINRTQGLDAIRKWVATLPWEFANGLKSAALAQGFNWTSKMSGEVTGDWYEEIEGSPEAIPLLPKAVENWGVWDPAGSMDWLVKRPESQLRDALIREIAVGWLTRRPDLAEPWILERLEEEYSRDRFLLPMTQRRIAERRYDDALVFAKQVPRKPERDYAIAGVLLEWMRLDPEAVEKYFVEAKVEESIVADVRARFDSPVRIKRRQAKQPSGSEG